jgi:hypothetical protein
MVGFVYHMAFIVVMIIGLLKWYTGNENIYEMVCMF